MVVPFVWMLLSSFKAQPDMFRIPPRLFPSEWIWTNYSQAIRTAMFPRFFLNSTVITVSIVVCQLFFNTLAGYAFSKLMFPLRELLFYMLLSTMMISIFVTILPLYVLMTRLKWINTFYALIVPGLSGAFGIFMMRQFIQTIPDDYLDAARMDGASEFAVVRSVIFPMSRPALSALGVFIALGAWNDFFYPLMMITTTEMNTIQLGITRFVGLADARWNLVMAVATLAIIPVLIVFLIFQRHFTEGIVLTGLKG
jgi:multiple sugar transport system permease protein